VVVLVLGNSSLFTRVVTVTVGTVGDGVLLWEWMGDFVEFVVYFYLLLCVGVCCFRVLV